MLNGSLISGVLRLLQAVIAQHVIAGEQRDDRVPPTVNLIEAFLHSGHEAFMAKVRRLAGNVELARLRAVIFAMNDCGLTYPRSDAGDEQRRPPLG